VVLGLALAGCTDDEAEISPTVPPTPPTRHVAAAVLPPRAAGYTVLGSFPVSGQLEATYALDTDPAALAVVRLTVDQAVGETTFDDDAWYGPSRCGLFDSSAAADAQQAGGVVPLVDGILTVVGTTVQSPEELSALATAVYEALP
jgi:hypothetical protein